MPIPINPYEIDVFVNENVKNDPQGVPLITLKINGRNALFVKQLATIFTESSAPEGLMRRLRDSGVFPEGDGYDMLSVENIKILATCEKNMLGKSYIEALFPTALANGVNIVYEDAALWLIARSQGAMGAILTKMLVNTFIAIRDGHYIQSEHSERLKARVEYTEAEKELKETVYKRGYENVGYYIMLGDSAFYGGMSTTMVKERKGVPLTRPLADFDSTIEMSAKSLAKRTANYAILENDIVDSGKMESEYISSNRGMRKYLMDRGIIPEDSAIEEDIKLIKKDSKTFLNNTGSIGAIKKVN